MEQYERADSDPPEGQAEQGGEDPATPAVLAGEAANAKEGVSETHISVLAAASEGEQEGVSETQISVPVAASEGAKKQDLEEPSPESDQLAAASGSVNREDREAFKNPMETRFEFQSAAPDATPPPASHRARSRGRKKASPTKFIAAGAAEGAGSEAPVPGPSSSSALAPAAGTHQDVSAISGGDQAASLGEDRKQKQACSAPFVTVLIAHASPPDSYRRLPSRSRKQYSPKRFAAAAGASTSAAAPAARDPTAPARDRKQPRPEHFIPEEAAATASAKARRSNIVLDRFLSSMARGSSAADWAMDVTAEDAGQGQPKRPRGVESFTVRDASRHAARTCGLRAAMSRFGASCGGASSSPAAPGEHGGSGRIYGVLVVLGASLALSVVSCVLYYIVGQSSEAAPSGESQDK